MRDITREHLELLKNIRDKSREVSLHLALVLYLQVLSAIVTSSKELSSLGLVWLILRDIMCRQAIQEKYKGDPHELRLWVQPFHPSF